MLKYRQEPRWIPARHEAPRDDTKELTMPSWIGPWEIAIVVIIALLIFGPRKLPELGSSFGKSIRGFKKGLKDGQDELNATVAEVKEATNINDEPVAKATTAEAVSSTTSAEATTAEATTAAATSTAFGTDTKPRCWGTYEAGDASCGQCTVASECSLAGAEAPTAV
jgi:sec-independent protein translocase protein TatA